MMNEFYDVILFAKFTFHMSILKPISEALDKLGVRHLLTTQRHIVYDMHNEHKKKFRIFVLCDEWINLFRDCSEICITTNHSLVSKNTTYSTRNSEADYICCASEWQKREFINKGVRPKKDFWITGYPAADRIFKNIFLKSEWLDVMWGNDRKKVLFCPTYNPQLNYIQALQKDHVNFFGNLTAHYDCGFKVHPVFPKKSPEHMEFLRGLAKYYGSTYVSEDSHGDIADAILWSNISVGDCSGATILSAIRNPVILFNNPDRAASSYFDSDGIEWRYREDFGYEIEDLKTLPDKVSEILYHDHKFESRRSFIDLIFGESKKGNSANEIAIKIEEIL